jgi:hypothetical protein
LGQNIAVCGIKSPQFAHGIARALSRNHSRRRQISINAPNTTKENMKRPEAVSASNIGAMIGFIAYLGMFPLRKNKRIVSKVLLVACGVHCDIENRKRETGVIQ